MAWIKCTDRMPPDMEPVMVTVQTDKGKRYVHTTQVRRVNGLDFEEIRDDGYSDIWVPFYQDFKKITHWAPWPEPAED